MSNGSAEPRDLRDYIRPVLARWWLFLIVVPVVTVGTYLYYSHKPKSYTASTQLFIQPSTLDQLLLGANGIASVGPIENLSLLVQTRAVGEEAARELAKEHARPEGGISAHSIENTSFITITATSPSAIGASKLANAYAKAFVDIQTRQLHGEASQTRKAAERQLREIGLGEAKAAQREAIEQKIQTLRLVAAQPGNAGIKQVQPAVAPSGPTGHEPTAHAIFALVLSILLCIGGAFGLEYMTRRMNSVEDVERVFELPVLTEVPKVDAPAPFDEHGVAMAKALHEPFHRLQMNLEMLSHERPLRTILVASAAPSEGKSIVTRNLALAYREAGRNVAVLDADFRKATMGGLLAAQEGPGLTDILAGQATFGQAIQEVPVPTLQNGNGHADEYVVASPARVGVREVGPGELAMVPAGLHMGGLAPVLSSGQLGNTLRTAADTFDTVIIDSSPLLAAADVLPLLSEADGVILVTRLGVSTRDSAQRLLSELRRVPNIHLVGVVVNGIPPRTYRTRAYGYYYG